MNLYSGVVFLSIFLQIAIVIYHETSLATIEYRIIFMSVYSQRSQPADTVSEKVSTYFCFCFKSQNWVGQIIAAGTPTKSSLEYSVNTPK